MAFNQHLSLVASHPLHICKVLRLQPGAMGMPSTAVFNTADRVEQELSTYAEIVRFQQQLRVADAERLANDLHYAVNETRADALRAAARQLELERSATESNGWVLHRVVLQTIYAQRS